MTAFSRAFRAKVLAKPRKIQSKLKFFPKFREFSIHYICKFFQSPAIRIFIFKFCARAAIKSLAFLQNALKFSKILKKFATKYEKSLTLNKNLCYNRHLLMKFESKGR